MRDKRQSLAVKRGPKSRTPNNVPIPSAAGAAAVDRNQLPRVRTIPHARPLQGLKTASRVSSSGEERDSNAQSEPFASSDVFYSSSARRSICQPCSRSVRSTVLARFRALIIRTIQVARLSLCLEISANSQFSCLLSAFCFATLIVSSEAGFGFLFPCSVQRTDYVI
jgi:hypothetical protein